MDSLTHSRPHKHQSKMKGNSNTIRGPDSDHRADLDLHSALVLQSSVLPTDTAGKSSADLCDELLSKVISHRTKMVALISHDGRTHSKGYDSELDNTKLSEFDFQWGIDSTTGDFLVRRPLHYYYYCIPYRTPVEMGTKPVLTREIELVNEQTGLKIEKLRLATDGHAGLEIMHLFVLDLLGRDTPAGKIFQQRASEVCMYACK